VKSQNMMRGDSHLFTKLQVIEKAAAKLPSEKKVTPDDFNFSKVLGKGNYGKVAKNPFPLTKKGAGLNPLFLSSF